MLAIVLFSDFYLPVSSLNLLPVVLYDCETSSLTLRQEHRLRVFENRVLRRIFGPKRRKWQEAWLEKL
jgi:hypothetical protein